MLERYAQFVTKQYWLVIVLIIAIFAVPIAGMQFVDFSTDYRQFFGGNDRHVSAFDELQATYTQNDSVMLAIEPNGSTVFDSEILGVIERATELAWKLPYATRVDSVTNFQHSFSKQDELITGPLVKDAQLLDEQGLERVKAIATTDPVIVNRLVSPQGHITGINVTLKLPETINTAVPKVVQQVRQLATDIEKSSAIKRVYLSGTVIINNAFLEVAQNDMFILIPIMFGLIILVLVALTRSLSSTMATFMIVGFANGFALGIGGWLGIQLTPPSAAAAPIIMTLSIAACVHLLTTYLRDFHLVDERAEGNVVDKVMDKKQAMCRSIHANFLPITLTSVTTVIGFLMMNFADSPPFHDLGNLVALGIVAAYFLTIIFLPALMMVLPVKYRETAQLGEKQMHSLAEFVIHKRGALLWFMLAVVAVLAIGIPKNQLNDEFVKYFDTSVKFRADNDFITDNLTGIYQLEYSINANDMDGINRVEYLQTLEDFANWYRQQSYVWHVQPITDIYKKANMNLHAGESEHYSIPDNNELAAQSLLLYEMSLPIGLDLNDQINVDKSATRFVVSTETIMANELIALEEKADQWLHKNAPAYMQSIATGPTVLFAHIGAGSIRTGLIGGITALVLISVLLSLVFGSFKVGALSLIPNLVPAAMAFGLWGYFYGQINMALATVISMTLGIVVDDTIHFVNKYLAAKRDHLSAEDAIRYAFSEVGLAITVTTFVLIAGFMVLTFSPFILNWGMGLLSAITIAFALLADFLLLPPILMKLEELRYAEKISAQVVDV